jgi:LuxR family transcriptional regulator, maltose regulon positive regulatory protein
MWPATAGGRTSAETRDVFATPWLAQADPRTAPAVLIPFLGIPSAHRAWVAAGFLLGAIARDAALISDTEDLLARVVRPAPPPGDEEAGTGRCEGHPRGNRSLVLTHGEIRVLHYLPTNLSAREIAGELYVSVNTVKTHQRHLYQKLGARSRSQAVERARAFGLLAPSPHRRGQ